MRSIAGIIHSLEHPYPFLFLTDLVEYVCPRKPLPKILAMREDVLFLLQSLERHRTYGS